MAQWARLCSLCMKHEELRKAVHQLYAEDDTKTTLEVRQRCPEWIENQNWQVSKEQEVSTLCDGLLDNIATPRDSHDAQPNVIELHLQLRQALSDVICDDRLNFIQFMSRCLQEEKNLMDSLTQNDADNFVHKNDLENDDEPKDDPAISFELQKMNNLMSEVCELEKLPGFSGELSMEERSGCIDEQWGNLMSEVCDLEKLPRFSFGELSMEERSECIDEQWGRLPAQMQERVGKLKSLLEDVWRLVEGWQHNELRKFAAVDRSPPPTTLKQVEHGCSQIARLLTGLLQLSCKILELSRGSDETTAYPEMERIQHELEKLLEQHIHRILVISSQAPRILKVVSKKSEKMMFVLSLLGGASLRVDDGVEVNADIVRSCDLPTIRAGKDFEPICTLEGGRGKAMSIDRTGEMRAEFRELVLTNTQRTAGTTADKVTCFKYAIICRTQIVVFGKRYCALAVSLPIVITSHTNQHVNATATLLWDAAFSLPGRLDFEDAPDASKREVVELLKALWCRTSTEVPLKIERPLNELQLAYLCLKAFGREVDDSQRISKEQLLKTSMQSKKSADKKRKDPQKDFTFWQWFMANRNLVHEYLHDEWNAGLIHGFMSRPEAERLLRAQDYDRCFLLRFSDNYIGQSNGSNTNGCLTVSVIIHSPYLGAGERKIIHVRKELEWQNISKYKLAPILAGFTLKGDNTPLFGIIYPSRPFDDAFRTSSAVAGFNSQDSSGYVAGELKYEIPMQWSGVSSSSSPPLDASLAGLLTLMTPDCSSPLIDKDPFLNTEDDQSLPDIQYACIMHNSSE